MWVHASKIDSEIRQFELNRHLLHPPWFEIFCISPYKSSLVRIPEGFVTLAAMTFCDPPLLCLLFAIFYAVDNINYNILNAMYS